MTFQGSPRVLYGVTAAATARAFLRGQLRHLSSQGCEVHLLVGEPGLEEFARTEDVRALHVVRASRNPSPLDLLTLLGLWRRLRVVRPDVVVMGTPKVGVFGTIAARLARVPVRVYLVHGYRAEGLDGLLGWVLRSLEKLACRSSTHVVAVSPSLRHKLLEEGLVACSKVTVLGSGSANGVDLDRFRTPTPEERAGALARFGIPDDAGVVSSVGRLTRDKGLEELPEVWEFLRSRCPNTWLLLVGPDEANTDEEIDALNRLRQAPQVRLVGHLADVQVAFWASDVHLLLSRREGLGMVALEAAACGVPTVAIAVTGVVDAVVADETGVLIPPSACTPEAVAAALADLLVDRPRRELLGLSGASRVRKNFAQDDVWERWAEFIRTRWTPRTKRGAWIR